MNHRENIYAAAYAAKVGGTLISFRDLHLVVYNYGSSPSLAYWRGRQKHSIQNLHFINPNVRDSRIEELRQQQTSFVLFRAARRIERRIRSAAASILA